MPATLTLELPDPPAPPEGYRLADLWVQPDGRVSGTLAEVPTGDQVGTLAARLRDRLDGLLVVWCQAEPIDPAAELPIMECRRDLDAVRWSAWKVA